MGAYDSSLTANATKSLGNPYDLKAFHQLTGEIFVTASVKNLEGSCDMKKLFNGHMKKVLWPSTFTHSYDLDTISQSLHRDFQCHETFHHSGINICGTYILMVLLLITSA